MSKHFILAEDKNNNYTLILRVKDNGELSYTPFVVAWGYNYKTDSWAQGHYFTDLTSAILYMHFKDKCEEVYEMMKDKYEAPFFSDQL